MDEFIGIIKLFGGNFAPNGYMYCAGQLLLISQYQALYSILGTTYGGDGRVNFALPDLRSRVPVGGGMGASPSLNNTTNLGAVGGEVNHTLIATEIPTHNHSVNAVSTSGNVSNPSGVYPAQTGTLKKEYSNSSSNATMNNTTISSTGQGQLLTAVQPTLFSRYITSSYGIFPQ